MYSYMSSSGYNGSMSEIYDIFRQHTSSLRDQQRKAYQAIEDWRNDLINQIGDYTFEQKRLVAEAFESQQKYLDDMRTQFVEISHIYERQRNIEDIKQLLEKCRNLEVQLVKLSFHSNDKEFIKVTLVERPEQMTQEESNPTKTRADQFENRSIHGNETKPVYNREFGSNSSSIPDRTNPSSTSAYDRLPRTNDNNNPNTNIIRDGDSNEKCPICFMIFPSYMSELTRSMHVEEHCKND